MGRPTIAIITRSAYYAVSVVKRSSVRPSVCLSRWSTAAAAAVGFAAEVGRGQQILIDEAAAAARHAGRVNFVGSTVRRSNILVRSIWFFLVIRHTHYRLTALCPGLPGVGQYQKKHLPIIHTHPAHQTSLNHLPLSTMIHSISVQFTCLAALSTTSV